MALHSAYVAPMSDQMRAAWGRRTDEELLRAYFTEELSAAGSRVVAELVAEKVGSIPEFVAGFASLQGEITARIRVRACHVSSALGGRDLPPMKGVVLLAANGIGFLPRGRDDHKGARFRGVLGVAESIFTQMQQTAQPIEDLSRLDLPVPLVAHIAESAVWVPHDKYDSLTWTSGTGEVACAGAQLLSFETLIDTAQSAGAWAKQWGRRFHRV